MIATRIPHSPTLYSVTSEKRLRCSKIGCKFNTEAKKYMVGDPCPTCSALALEQTTPGQFVTGALEECCYQVDLAAFYGIGSCSCENATCYKIPNLKRFSPDHLKMFTMKEILEQQLTCKHVEVSRRAACEPENLRALLMALPQQEQEDQP